MSNSLYIVHLYIYNTNNTIQCIFNAIQKYLSQYIYVNTIIEFIFLVFLQRKTLTR